MKRNPNLTYAFKKSSTTEPDMTMLLSSAYQEFMLVDRAVATQKTYRSFFPKFIEAIGDRDISTIKDSDIDAYFKSLREQTQKYVGHPQHPVEEGELSPDTLIRNLKMVRALFNHCVRRGYISRSPAHGTKLRKSTRRHGSSKALDPDLLLKILEASRESMNETLATRDFAIVLFLISTGCRSGGCASLRLPTLNFSERSALLIEKADNELIVYFGLETERALRAWLKVRPKVQHDYVFTSSRKHVPLTSEAIGDLFKRIRKRLDLPFPIGPHRVRHTFGQTGADSGMPAPLVKERMGHSDIRITLEYYYNQDKKRLIHAARRFELLPLTGEQYTPPPVEPETAEKLKKIIRLSDYRDIV